MNKVKIPEHIMTFTKWWKQNKAVYEKAKVSKDIAATIWDVAVDSTTDGIRATLIINNVI